MGQRVKEGRILDRTKSKKRSDTRWDKEKKKVGYWIGQRVKVVRILDRTKSKKGRILDGTKSKRRSDTG